MQKLIFENSRGQNITITNSAPFLLQKFDPEPPKSTIITTKAPGQDGKTHHDTLLDERALSVQVAILADSSEGMFEKRKQLYAIFNPKLDITLVYENSAGKYKIQCSVQESPTPKDRHEPVQEFLIQLYCSDPYWKELDEIKVEMAEWIGDFQFPFEIPEETGVEMGHRMSTLIANCFNAGDVECGIRIEFTALASVVNPSILNVYTQEFIKVKRTLSAGDKLVINTDFGNKRVTMIKDDGTKSNVFNYIDLQSTFLQLTVGDNLLRYNAEQGIDNLDVGIYFTPRYVGV